MSRNLKTVRHLRAASSPFVLASWGDAAEQEAGKFLSCHLPAYEPWWQLIVFPFRKQPGIWLRDDLPPPHEAVIVYNYSLFRSAQRTFDSLISSQIALSQTGEVGSDHFYDFIIWIAISYERIRQQAGALFDYLLGPNSERQREVTEWACRADELMDRLPNEFSKSFATSHRKVKKYRNTIIHGIKFPGGRDRVPKPDEVKSLVFWSDWAQLVKKGESEWRKRTVERMDLMIECWLDFEDLSNGFLRECLNLVMQEYGSRRFPDQNLSGLPDLRTDHTANLTNIPLVDSGSAEGMGFGMSSDTTYPS